MPVAPDLSGHALDGRYELEELIGEGAFGRVYRGRDRRLARPVAVKVIKPWWSEDPVWVRSFEREAQLLARVNDPGIVQIFDVGQSEREGLYYVAELVEGPSLAERLKAGPLPVDESVTIAAKLGRALGRAHARGIVHRDVKPANVLLSSDGHVKVADFGVARLTEGTSDVGGPTVAGTPRYMAPEQARGGDISPATDVYAVGVLLYEMLAGRPPFLQSSAVELALAHVGEEPPPLPVPVPRPLAAIVTRALAKDPGDRYADGTALADALEDGRRESAVAAAKAYETVATLVLPEPPRRSWRPTVGRRALLAIAIAVALGLAGVLSLVLLSASDTVKVPDLRGLDRAGVSARLRRSDLRATFSSRHSDSVRRGRAISQRPPAGVTVDHGSVVQIVLSSGPPPVPIPAVVGRSASDAQQAVAVAGLRYAVELVPAPGSTTGAVVRETPSAGTRVARGSTVFLAVAEAPRWRPLTSFAGGGTGHSVPYRIRGSRWRVVYAMSYDGTCTFILFCSGPSARVTSLPGAANVAGFDLATGSGNTKTFTTGQGVYQLNVTPGSDSAHWSVAVQDWY